MSQQRSSDVAESLGTTALVSGGLGILAFLLGLVLFLFKGEGTLVGLAAVLMVLGGGGIVYAIYEALQIRKVASHVVQCPYCNYKNRLTEPPTNIDLMCGSCYKMMPMEHGAVLPVSQVRCGFCNELNYYNKKTQVLLCEGCNREVPISLGDDVVVTKRLAPGYAVKDDDNVYELVLVSHDGFHTEELIASLQHTLALNRNHVKDMLDQLPVTLLQGIPRMKAEMLQSQLAVHGGKAEFKAMQ